MNKAPTIATAGPPAASTPTSHYHPQWHGENLERHFKRHGKEVAAALGKGGAAYSKGHYAENSRSTVHLAAYHFEAEHWNGREIEDTRAYFVDSRLLQAVTDEPVSHFVTYYPLSFDGTVKPEDLAEMQEGDRRLQFEEWLENKEIGQVFQNIRRKHGFD
jgi:hypothetical protein